MRVELLAELISLEKPDILLLQEIKCETEKFPYENFSHLPYNIYVHGQKSYNGVAIFSKFRADEVLVNFDHNPCHDQARFIQVKMQTPIGFCNIISLYAPNGGEVNSEKFKLKLDFYDSLICYLKSNSIDEKYIIGGDFNIAAFDIDVYDPKALANVTCFTLAERQKLRTLLNSGFEDLYRIASPKLQEFSWWDYRAGAFEQNKGMRIDSIIASTNMINDLAQCYINRDFRSKQKPSDHAPVTVTIYR